jgi:hypothetical protein
MRARCPWDLPWRSPTLRNEVSPSPRVTDATSRPSRLPLRLPALLIAALGLVRDHLGSQSRDRLIETRESALLLRRRRSTSYTFTEDLLDDDMPVMYPAARILHRCLINHRRAGLSQRSASIEQR